jgi:hypothetical protein
LGNARRPAHYLAIPPPLFETVIEQLGQAGLVHGARVIVEKPFGRDLASARELNRAARSVFSEDSIFRIRSLSRQRGDHEPALLPLANSFLEPIWNRNYMASVRITLADGSACRAAARSYPHKPPPSALLRAGHLGAEAGRQAHRPRPTLAQPRADGPNEATTVRELLSIVRRAHLDAIVTHIR